MLHNPIRRSLGFAVLLLAVLSGITITFSVYAETFPEPVYVSLKLENKVMKFPQEAVWDGGPNMLYDAITPDGKVLLVTSPNTASVYAFDSNSGKQLAVIKVDKASKGIKISPNGK